jgi:ABC-2 type transport system ATP-binding protein
MGETVISAEGLTRRFGEKVAVDHLTFEVLAGEVFGYLGHNGAGKTTTVRLLNGVLGPNGGKAMVLGLSPVDEGARLRLRTGVLTETPSFDERLTARENLRFFAELYDVPPAEVGRRVEDILATFDLGDRGNDKVGAYSKGMKQRLALARTMVHRPDILFLDEPTAALDPVAARQVHEIISRTSRQEGRTVFLCTHNLLEAQQLCDRVAVLEHGRIVALGTPAELGRQFAHDIGLEIEVAKEDMGLALTTLQSMDGKHDAKAEGALITVQGVGREGIPAVVSGLATAGVRVYRVAPGEASLEDVYFAIHAREGGAG